VKPTSTIADRIMDACKLTPRQRDRARKDVHLIIGEDRKELAHETTAAWEKRVEDARHASDLRVAAAEARGAVRERLPDERTSRTRTFRISWPNGDVLQIYAIAGFYADGRLGELFLRVGKEGSITAGALDAFAAAVSLALQYGVPADVILSKFKGWRFEPNGFTGDPIYKNVLSVIDAVCRWLWDTCGCGATQQKASAA